LHAEQKLSERTNITGPTAGPWSQCRRVLQISIRTLPEHGAVVDLVSTAVRENKWVLSSTVSILLSTLLVSLLPLETDHWNDYLLLQSLWAIDDQSALNLYLRSSLHTKARAHPNPILMTAGAAILRRATHAVRARCNKSQHDHHQHHHQVLLNNDCVSVRPSYIAHVLSLMAWQMHLLLSGALWHRVNCRSEH
jgi:hypothetical protein